MRHGSPKDLQGSVEKLGNQCCLQTMGRCPEGWEAGLALKTQVPPEIIFPKAKNTSGCRRFGIGVRLVSVFAFASVGVRLCLGLSSAFFSLGILQSFPPSFPPLLPLCLFHVSWIHLAGLIHFELYNHQQRNHFFHQIQPCKNLI